MDNTGDRKAIRRKEKQAAIDTRARQDVVRNIMSTTQGRQWMWDKLAEPQVFSSTFNGDALQSAFNEGRRAQGLSMLAEIMLACPDQYITAQKEANVRSTLDERRSSPIDDGRDFGPTPADGDGGKAGGYDHDDDPADRPSFTN